MSWLDDIGGALTRFGEAITPPLFKPFPDEVPGGIVETSPKVGVTVPIGPTPSVPDPHGAYEAERARHLAEAQAKHDAAVAQESGFKDWLNLAVIRTSQTIEAATTSADGKSLGDTLSSLVGDTPKYLALGAVGAGVLALVLAFRR